MKNFLVKENPQMGIKDRVAKFVFKLQEILNEQQTAPFMINVFESSLGFFFKGIDQAQKICRLEGITSEKRLRFSMVSDVVTQEIEGEKRRVFRFIVRPHLIQVQSTEGTEG